MGNDGTRIEMNCLESLFIFLRQNDINVGSHNNGILFHVDEGAKILVKKENEDIKAVFVPSDLETTGLIMSILLEKSNIGNLMVFGYLVSFLAKVGIEGSYDEGMLIVNDENMRYCVKADENGIKVNRHILE